MKSAALAVFAAVLVLGCVQGMPWGHRAVNPPDAANLANGAMKGIASPLYTLDGDGARAVESDTEDDNDLGESDGESATAQLTARAKEDAGSAGDKADDIRAHLKNIMGDIHEVGSGNAAVAEELSTEMTVLPDELNRHDMEQDVSNVQNDAKMIADRLAAGKVRLGADAVLRAQKAHRDVDTEAAGMKANADELLGRQKETMVEVKHYENLASKVKADIRKHEDEIPNLGKVDGATTSELPAWVKDDYHVMSTMRDTLERVTDLEAKTRKGAAEFLQNTGTVEELGEDDTDEKNDRPKYDFENDADEATPDLNAAQRSVFEDP